MYNTWGGSFGRNGSKQWFSPKRYGGHGDGSHGDGGQGDRGHGDNGDFVMVLAFEVHLNTGDSSAVPQGALLVFQVDLEYFIEIVVVIVIKIPWVPWVSTKVHLFALPVKADFGHHVNNRSCLQQKDTEYEIGKRRYVVEETFM